MILLLFWVYPSYSEVQQIWSYIDIEITCTCLKELFVILEIIRTHIVQDSVSIWYVGARKLCVVVDSQVKIWTTLSYKIGIYHFYAFHTILVQFWQYLRSLNIILVLINRQ